MRRRSLRERAFECVVVVDRKEYRSLVRAWDTAGAEEQLRAMLRESGLAEPASISISEDWRPAPRVAS